MKCELENAPATALESLKDEVEVVWNIIDSRRLMGWDQQILLPPSAAAARSRMMASLSRVSHERLTSDSLLSLLEAAEEAVADLPSDHDDACFCRIVRRERDRRSNFRQNWWRS